MLARAHGALITSATLRDRSDAAPEDWATAEVRTGALHLPLPAKRLSLASPFDYAAQTRVLIVNDVRRTDGAQVAAAYRELFLAAGGGALGLFTAIRRLRQVHERIAGPLDEAGLALHAQHVDAIDTPTLVDIFRAEEDSCLLGTDAVRDGVDVPGRALRLIVFDRVPWPRPDILHRARRRVFGGSAYDDMLARLRLKHRPPLTASPITKERPPEPWSVPDPLSWTRRPNSVNTNSTTFSLALCSLRSS